jgi:hypothetical protein
MDEFKILFLSFSGHIAGNIPTGMFFVHTFVHRSGLRFNKFQTLEVTNNVRKSKKPIVRILVESQQQACHPITVSAPPFDRCPGCSGGRLG